MMAALFGYQALFCCGADDFNPLGSLDVAPEAVFAFFAVHIGAHSFACRFHLADDVRLGPLHCSAARASRSNSLSALTE